MDIAYHKSRKQQELDIVTLSFLSVSSLKIKPPLNWKYYQRESKVHHVCSVDLNASHHELATKYVKPSSYRWGDRCPEESDLSQSHSWYEWKNDRLPHRVLMSILWPSQTGERLGLSSPTGLERYLSLRPSFAAQPSFSCHIPVQNSRSSLCNHITFYPELQVSFFLSYHFPPPASVWTTYTFYPSPPPSLQPYLQNLQTSSGNKAQLCN